MAVVPCGGIASCKQIYFCTGARCAGSLPSAHQHDSRKLSDILESAKPTGSCPEGPTVPGFAGCGFGETSDLLKQRANLIRGAAASYILRTEGQVTTPRCSTMQGMEGELSAQSRHYVGIGYVGIGRASGAMGDLGVKWSNSYPALIETQVLQRGLRWLAV